MNNLAGGAIPYVFVKSYYVVFIKSLINMIITITQFSKVMDQLGYQVLNLEHKNMERANVV